MSFSSGEIVTGCKKVKVNREGQRQYVEMVRTRDVVLCDGPAGSGKTYLAVAMALEALNAQTVKRIVLARPAVEAGERLGYLPGDQENKMAPYLRPLLDVIHHLMDPKSVKEILANQVEISPLAYTRGRTFNDTFMIMDESQNTTPSQMKMFLTRMGYSSKCVIVGDTSQTDIVGKNGFVDAVDRLQKIERIGLVTLTAADIHRHPVVAEIVNAYANVS